MDKSVDDLLRDLGTSREEMIAHQKLKREKKEAEENARNWMDKVPTWGSNLPFDLYRYILSLMLVSTKLGWVGLAGTLTNVSWVWILAPALVLEVIYVAAIIVTTFVAAFAAVFGLMHAMVNSVIESRRIRKKIENENVQKQ